jgi:polysaccharide export outer membrane protein
MWVIFTLLIGFSAQGLSQNPPQPKPFVPPPLNEEFLTNRPANVPTSLVGSEYQIGRDDLIEVSVFEAPELNTTSRVSANGFVSLNLIGPIEAGGKTTQEVEKTIADALGAKYLNDPHVTVLVREYASQPVSILGAVKVPGIYQIKGQKFLLDMLATAQGLDQTTAGKTIQVMRRPKDDSEQGETIVINAEDLFQNGKTELNIPIQAGDIINVLLAGSIFVVGEVVRPGEFPLHQGKNVSAAQAVALGGGFTREARKAECKIIRVHRDGTKEEISVDVARIYAGSVNDVTLMPNDILFVPANKIKTGLMRTLDTTLGIVSGRLIYRF